MAESVSLSRRSVLTGLGAILAVAAAPASITAVERILPDIVLRTSTRWPCTIQCLWDCIVDLHSQVETFGPLTVRERIQVAAMVDSEIDKVRPVGVQVLFEAPLADLMAGEFAIMERGPGTVVIEKWRL